MDNEVVEKKLARNGFSDKEITRLREITEKENETYLDLLRDLRKRFFAGMSMIVVMLVLFLIAAITSPSEHGIGMGIASIIVFAAVYFITPMKLATKAYRYLNNNH